VSAFRSVTHGTWAIDGKYLRRAAPEGSGWKGRILAGLR
jgi:hypothetical protein